MGILKIGSRPNHSTCNQPLALSVSSPSALDGYRSCVLNLTLAMFYDAQKGLPRGSDTGWIPIIIDMVKPEPKLHKACGMRNCRECVCVCTSSFVPRLVA